MKIRDAYSILGPFGTILVGIGFICLVILFLMTSVLPFMDDNYVKKVIDWAYWIFLT